MFEDARVGTDIIVTIESADITGNDAGNYSLSDVVPWVEATITESNGINTNEISCFQCIPTRFQITLP